MRLRLVSLLLLLCLYLAVPSRGQAGSPNTAGFMVRLTVPGLDYGRSVAVGILLQKLHGISIPDQSGSSGKIHYTLSGMHITDFTMPSTALGFVPGSGLKFSFSGASVSLSGEWHYKALFVKDSGTFDMRMSGLSLSTVLVLSRDVTGRPSVSAGGCSSGVGDVDIKFHGGASWLYNLFKHLIENNIRDHLKGQLCDQVTEAINSDLENSLQEISITAKVDEFTEVDYSLLSPPDTRADMLDIPCKGEFYSLQHHSEFPVPAPPMDLGTSADRMLYFGLSEFLFNSAGYAYQASGALTYIITEAMLPKDAPFHLNTSSLAPIAVKVRTSAPQPLGAGRFHPFPTGASEPRHRSALTLKDFPGLAVEVRVESSAGPTLSIAAGNVTLRTQALATFTALWPNGTHSFLFSINANTSLDARLEIDANKLHGTLTLDSMLLTLVKSDVGDVHVNLLQSIIKFIAKTIILPKVNERLSQGIPMPLLKKVKIVNAVLLNKEAFIVVGMDLQYSP
ncbi:bactericidal permeability-increasing protein-like isoform X2 [Petromyzon marinus]|uniref:bactericidal permeability-increasing protein-like isoform X2 n=1 Tax=Petromyzon marinus TaxID=7757 RepID=UPI003F72A160